MTFVYPAVFTPNREKGGLDVSFPDLEMCTAYGRDFEEATDINFYVGRAMNPAHQNPDLPINFNIKMNIVEQLSKCLEDMGKRIRVSYF